MNQDLKPRVVLITGAGGALGAELARQSAVAGWQTVLVDKSTKRLEQIYDQIIELGGVEPLLHVMDLAIIGTQQCEELVDALENELGRLDGLVHCAASFQGLQPLDHIDPQDWLRQIQINLNAPWLLSTFCLRLLRKAPRASLVFLSEDLEKVSGANWGCYGVSKAAVSCLARQFSAELSNTDIQVLVVNPGPMRSTLRAKAYHSENPYSVPDPAVTAAKVLLLIEGKAPATATLVSLAEMRFTTA